MSKGGRRGNKPPRRRNPAARALEDPLFRQRRNPRGTEYRRPQIKRTYECEHCCDRGEVYSNSSFVPCPYCMTPHDFN